VNAVPAIVTATGRYQMHVSLNCGGISICAYLLGWREVAR
jgi:hypothetical protein